MRSLLSPVNIAMSPVNVGDLDDDDPLPLSSPLPAFAMPVFALPVFALPVSPGVRKSLERVNSRLSTQVEGQAMDFLERDRVLREVHCAFLFLPPNRKVGVIELQT